MIEPRIPENEPQRMAALRSLDVLFTPAEERFDRITRLAARLLDTPIAVVSLVADKCQWFKSIHGLDATETPREVSFCGHAILSPDTLVVENATLDPRFADNPLVTHDPCIRFYAGHPLHTEDGSAVGTLCVIDRVPRQLREDELAVLRDLAALVETELQRRQMSEAQLRLMRERDELQRKAMIDGLTRVWNRAAFMELLAAEVARAQRGVPLCLAMVDADHFKQVNDVHGHQAGDGVLVELASRIRGSVRDFDSVGRYGGEEFGILLSNCNIDVAQSIAERIRSAVAAQPVATPAGPLSVTVSIGIATCDPSLSEPERLIGAADAALYRAKNKGRNRVES